MGRKKGKQQREMGMKEERKEGRKKNEEEKEIVWEKVIKGKKEGNRQ